MARQSEDLPPVVKVYGQKWFSNAQKYGLMPYHSTHKYRKFLYSIFALKIWANPKLHANSPLF